jgi:hypothetical protein
MSFPITDIVVASVLLFLTINGASQGFLRSAVGPASMMLSTLAAWLIHATTKNIGITLLAGLLGPFVLGWIFALVFKLLLPKHETPVPSLISRIGGALLNIGWGMPLLAGGVVLLALVPINQPTLVSMRQDVLRSFTYTTMRPLFHLPDPQQKALATAKTIDPANSELLKDERLQEVLKDPALLEAIENKDFAKILSNPKIVAMSMDPAFVIKALKTASEQQPPLSFGDDQQ